MKWLVKEWSKVQGHTSKQMEEANNSKINLDRESQHLDSNLIFLDLQHNVRALKGVSREKIRIEEADLKQKSKINQFKLGDSNSKFFSLATKDQRTPLLIS